MAYIDTQLKKRIISYLENLTEGDVEDAKSILSELTPKKPGRKVGWRKKVVLQPNKVLTPPL